MKECRFSSESVAQLVAFLGATHPRGGRDSCWAALPTCTLRHIGNWVLDPLCNEFVVWHPMSIVKDSKRALVFGVRLQQNGGMAFHTSNDEGVALCGPCMHRNSGVYILEMSISNIFSLDGFCRADVGVVVNEQESRRCGSGIWWLAGDGDVFVAGDAGGVSGNASGGWIGDDTAVEDGVLPKWDANGSTVGLVLDTHRCRLGFTKSGTLLPFEVSIPGVALPLRFGVGWSGDTAGRFQVQSIRRFVRERSCQLLQELAAARPPQRRDCTAAVLRHLRSTGGVLEPEVAAAALCTEALEESPECRQAIAATFAEVIGGFSCDFAAAALQSLPLHSCKEQLALDLAPFASRPQIFEAAILAEVPGLSKEVRAKLASRLPQPQGRDGWLRMCAWCCQ
eukprot:gb/GFBE01077199.1/.p1 GENE.gb/GFBE01077199.1/~~gb/GFBE01077199.1/.p1  ORF type:complete len:395 (+),score=63.11 gb/GFBE01077199.1/:1-1185(+)